MRRAARRASVGFAALVVFALASWLAFRGYLTPAMLVYYLSFKWCL